MSVGECMVKAMDI